MQVNISSIAKARAFGKGGKRPKEGKTAPLETR